MKKNNKQTDNSRKKRLTSAAKQRAWLEKSFGVDGLYVSRAEGKPAKKAASAGNAAKVLERIDKEVRACKRCELCKEATHGVPGDGSPKAELVFVGEGPGFDEDRQGKPFVGRAGKLLDKIIVAMGLKREDVYITNVVKHRPPGNRTPTKQEIATCHSFLIEQLETIRPKIICALGGPAAQTLLKTDTNIGRLRGTFHRYPESPDILVMATYHPAYLLRNPGGKRMVWEDVKKIMEVLGKPIPE